MKKIKSFFKNINLLNAAQLTLLSFFIASIVGGLLLTITERNTIFTVDIPKTTEVLISPVASSENITYNGLASREIHTFLENSNKVGLDFTNAWFTSTSALCVTGLTSIDFSTFSNEGKFIVLVLIQMGGLGIILFTSVLAIVIFRGLSERISIKTLVAKVVDSKVHEISDIIKFTVFFTLFFEITGALIIFLRVSNLPQTLIEGESPLWWSIFHSISAFNNAGFSLNSNNLVNFVSDPIINLTISSLIIAGGLGYPVLIATYAFFRKRFGNITQSNKEILDIEVSGVASKVQIRVAIFGTIILIFFGTVFTLLLELNNPVLESYSLPQKILISFFQSVSTRTAGFNTIDVGALHIATLFLFLIFMFIGANPAGTAGGIKIPTVAVLYGYIKDWFTSPGKPVTLLGRKISKFAVSHAIRLLFFSIIIICITTFLISIAESRFLITPDPIFNFQKILFEIVSAFGTVGMSMGYSGGLTSFSGILSDFSKVLLILVMLIGRVGPLVLLQSLPWKHPDAHKPISKDHMDSDSIQIG